MSSVSPRSSRFTDRLKPRLSQGSVPDPAVKVVEAENDFPFAYVDSVRIGSAHAVCAPSHEAENIDLMLRISTHILRRHEPELLPAKVSVDYKSDASSVALSNDFVVHTAAPDIATSTATHFEPSFVDRRWMKGLYLCVLARGQLEHGVRGYAYFGVFSDTFVDFFDRYQPIQPFNPNQLKAIVLARSTGEPSVEIREFMRMKFSFDHESTILELSNGE